MKNGRIVMSIAGAIVLGFSSMACDTMDREPAYEPEERVESAQTTPTSGLTNEKDIIGEIMQNPAKYNNKTVTVVSDVEEVYGNYGFKLDEESYMEGGIDNDLLVLFDNTKGTNALGEISERIVNDDVVVTGTVKTFVVGDVERELAIDFTPEFEAEWQNKPVLIANSIQRASDARAGM